MGDAHGVEAMTRQEREANQITQRVGERQILVVMPPLERPAAWLEVPLLHPGRGDGP